MKDQRIMRGGESRARSVRPVGSSGRVVIVEAAMDGRNTLQHKNPRRSIRRDVLAANRFPTIRSRKAHIRPDLGHHWARSGEILDQIGRWSMKQDLGGLMVR